MHIQVHGYGTTTCNVPPGLRFPTWVNPNSAVRSTTGECAHYHQFPRDSASSILACERSADAFISTALISSRVPSLGTHITLLESRDSSHTIFVRFFQDLYEILLFYI